MPLIHLRRKDMKKNLLLIIIELLFVINFVNNSFEGCICGLVVANDIVFILMYVYSLLLMCSKV